MTIPPVPVFPPASSLVFVRDAKLQAALTASIAATAASRSLAVGGFPSPVSIADIGSANGSTSTVKFAGFRDTEEHYTASTGKVGVLYAAFALRDMVRRFAAAKSPRDADDLFKQLEATVTPSIVAAVPGLPFSSGDLTPRYRDMFSAVKLGGPWMINFTPAIESALNGMIVDGENTPTSACVLGVRYSYLNGALASAGLFDASAGQGLWVATTYDGKLPRVLIDTVNAGKSEAAASTSDALMRLLTMIALDGVLERGSCGEMRRRMSGAVGANGGKDQSWITRTDVPNFLPDAALTHDKVGLGTITAGRLAGAAVVSEIFTVDAAKVTGLAASKSYCVCYQNVRNTNVNTGDMATLLRTTIAAYERP